jgi:ADP-heptose:LPS heptosyltransferase
VLFAYLSSCAQPERDLMAYRSSESAQRRSAGSHGVEICAEVNGELLALYDFCAHRPVTRKLLVLKLDHRGDFLIGLPALEQLRTAFPSDHITLMCGSWNADTARRLCIADDIRTYDYFPENVQQWNGTPLENISRFREVSKGQFDIALDLRVDEDTRPLLNHIDAALRCGVGSRSRHPYLNIALPDEFETREAAPVEAETVVLNPNALLSRMPTQTPFFHETDFSVTDMHLIYGPYIRLPLGKLRAEFGFQLSEPIIRSKSRAEIVVEVVQADLQETIAFKRVQQVSNLPHTVLEVEFANDDPTARYEFRVYVGGHPRRTRLRFFGIRIEVIERGLPHRRYLPVELHVGERLSLLVQLVADRVRRLYGPDLLERIVGGSRDVAALTQAPTSTKCIVIAPVSNSTIRDWPIERYIKLIGALMTRLECQIILVGSRSQASDLNHICEQCQLDHNVVNLAGRTGWSELAALLRRADLVIANNSGVAHLAAACGRPTLAIYSGSHQPQEWGPRGDTARVLTAAVSCSPCGYERLELCPHDHLCMTLIEPETVLDQALEMLARGHSTARGVPSHRMPVPAWRGALADDRRS